MLPITVTQTGAGSSRWVYTSDHMTPFNLSVACVVDGTVDYTVEACYQDPAGKPYDFPATGPIAVPVFPNADVTAKTDNQVATYEFPILAWRVTVNSGAGSVTATGLQAGISGP